MTPRILAFALTLGLAVPAPAGRPVSRASAEAPFLQKGKQKAPKPTARQKTVEKRKGSAKRGNLPPSGASGSLDEPSEAGKFLAPDAGGADGTGSSTEGEAGGPAKGRLDTGEFHLATDAEITDWFEIADYDRNGWISFGESAHAMGFDRPRFAVYDNDRDGRFQYPEYKLFYFDTLEQGTFAEPKPAPEPAQPPPRDPDQLRNAYDSDLDEHISSFELETLLADYRRADLGPAQILAAEDVDLDGRLSLSELEGLVALLYPVSVDGARVELMNENAAGSLLELFRKVVPRDSPRTGTPSPPLVTGPVPHFSRLDLDNDGAISLEDLRNLLRPVTETVRLSSVLNSLDLDGDGVLNPVELERALVHTVDPPRR